MNIDFENIIFPSIVSAISGIFGWVVGRKKENVEVDSNEIANTKEIIEMWKVTAKEMKEEVAELKDKIEALTKEVHTLRAENIELRTKLGITNESNQDK
jgi:predicted RNase H-like nuclease (RuvC/YqgF family)